MRKKIALCWFRQDLRLSDNLALLNASKAQNILPLYILDTVNSGRDFLGSASKIWLHHSLKSLNQSLDGKLWIKQGDPFEIIKKLLQSYSIEAVYWGRCYEPWRRDRDEKIKAYLTDQNIEVRSFNNSLLWEPWTIKKDDGSHYKVFTPFFRKGCLNHLPPREPLAKPSTLRIFFNENDSQEIDDLELLPSATWGKKVKEFWKIGEDEAQVLFNDFLRSGINNYKEGRNFPSDQNVSRLSPYLRFGQVSPNQLWYGALKLGEDKNIDHFCSELGWREFSYSQLYYNPSLSTKNLQVKFDSFPWDFSSEKLVAWQKGLTGIPMVDAGMRELWETGYMHNRSRMIVGSFLVKNLLIDWREGERWFWDTLCDADLANNSAGWQWIAGCGADAAPYFRIFNPVTQGEKFDPDGNYVRRFIPEIAKLPNKFLFNPWQAPKEILQQAKVSLGKNYPNPIVDLKLSRERALSAFKSLQ